jgi:hypothetical protein
VLEDERVARGGFGDALSAQPCSPDLRVLPQDQGNQVTTGDGEEGCAARFPADQPARDRAMIMASPTR